MSHEPYSERLNDYVDGRLESAERARIEAHLEQCAECRREVEAVKSLLVAAGRLPRSIEPSRDLWPAVVPRLGARHGRRRRILRPRYAVAAAAILAIAFSLTQVRTKKAREGPASSTMLQQPSATFVSLVDQWRSAEATYERAAGELEAALDAVRDELDPETVARVEANLKIVDDAIRETRRALRADPANIEVLQLLAAVHEKKLDLLQQATRYERL